MLRIMYGWPMRRLHNERKNENQNRLRSSDLSSRVIRIIEDCNVYDAELYQWIKHRFATQCAMFEPQLSEDLKHFRKINGVLDSFGKYLPYKIRKQLAEVFLYGQGNPWHRQHSQVRQASGLPIVTRAPRCSA